MEDISSLIKEAKPLYFARKKRNNRIKATFAMLFCVVMVGMFSPKENNTYNLDYDYYLFGTEVTYSDNVSVIEEMGLPTDEYGMLMVS